MMQILVLNVGSSSAKFNVFDMRSNEQILKAEIERVTHIEDAIAKIPAALKAACVHEIHAVGHRVAHGGDKFKHPCLIDEGVIAGIEKYVPLAPLHNPSTLAAMRMAQRFWPVPQAAVFDTAFHETMPEVATTYAIPEGWRKMGVRRYGFHGISHQYILARVAEELKIAPTSFRLISCHLGNGASVCAIDRGLSVDTSMGMTTLEGVVMGTRSGDVDPGIFSYLQQNLGLSGEDIENQLYHNSGLAALSGISQDLRDIEKQAASNAKARLALEIYAYRVKKYIGAYAAAMGGVDVIAFTAGIGENSADMRARICSNLDYLGLQFDQPRNEATKFAGFEVVHLHKPSSQIKVLVTPTREEWMVARETNRLLAP